MKKLVAALLAFAAFGIAQNTNAEYAVYKQTSLTSAVETITIQQPASPSVTVVGEVASVYCSVACNATVTQLSSTATATTLAIKTLNGTGIPSGIVAFSSSNTSGGTVLNVLAVAAGETKLIDLSKLYLSKGAGINLSIGTDSITGTVRILMQWQEKP